MGPVIPSLSMLVWREKKNIICCEAPKKHILPKKERTKSDCYIVYSVPNLLYAIIMYICHISSSSYLLYVILTLCHTYLCHIYSLPYLPVLFERKWKGKYSDISMTVHYSAQVFLLMVKAKYFGLILRLNSQNRAFNLFIN